MEAGAGSGNTGNPFTTDTNSFQQSLQWPHLPVIFQLVKTGEEWFPVHNSCLYVMITSFPTQFQLNLIQCNPSDNFEKLPRATCQSQPQFPNQIRKMSFVPLEYIDKHKQKDILGRMIARTWLCL